MKTQKTLIAVFAVIMGIGILFQSCTEGKHKQNETDFGQELSVQEEGDCDSDDNYFIINDKIYVHGTDMKKFQPISTDTERKSTNSKTVSASNFWQCTDNSLQKFEITEEIGCPEVQYSNGVIYIKTSSPSVSESSVEQPTIYSYTKDSSLSDSTLYLIVSYSSESTYSSQSIKFTPEADMMSKYDTIVTYVLIDDPKTSRGTVTTVQSHTNWDKDK